MRIAIMQPYVFPYLGYYQLVQAVDQFVFFDDVNFIKKGWIHRNGIEVEGRRYRFTVPLQKVSQNKTIRDTLLHPVEYLRWRKKFLATLYQSYGGSPFFNTVYPLINDILFASVGSIASLAACSIVAVAEYLEVDTSFIDSSNLPYNRGGNGQDKLISICQLQQASTYINPIGGKELYEPEEFKQNNIQLNFLQPANIIYSQSTPTFISNLSIIDILMHCSVSEIQEFLTQYKLVTKTSVHEPS